MSEIKNNDYNEMEYLFNFKQKKIKNNINVNIIRLFLDMK